MVSASSTPLPRQWRPRDSDLPEELGDHHRRNGCGDYPDQERKRSGAPGRHIDFAGKTGTAQVVNRLPAPPTWGQQALNAHNAWFVGVAPRRNAAPSWTVLAEHEG